MSRITMTQIVGSNFEHLNQMFDDLFNIHKLIMLNEGRGMDPYKEFIKARLRIRLEPMNPFLSLYDEDTSRSIIKSLLDKVFPDLFQNVFIERLMVNSNWLDYDNLGKTTYSGTATNTGTTNMTNSSNTTDKVGYQGYSISNQAGQFNVNTGESSNNGTTNSNSSSTNANTQLGGASRLQYMKFLQEHIDEKFTYVVENIKSQILQLIY